MRAERPVRRSGANAAAVHTAEQTQHDFAVGEGAVVGNFWQSRAFFSRGEQVVQRGGAFMV
jgi:hypothetical protein